MSTTSATKSLSSKLTVLTTTATIKEKPNQELTNFDKGRILHSLLSPYWEYGMLTHTLDVLNTSPDNVLKNTVNNITTVISSVLDKLISTDNNVMEDGKTLLTYSISSAKIDSQRTKIIVSVVVSE